MAQERSPVGLIVVAGGVLLFGWLAVRSMTATQQKAYEAKEAGVAQGGGAPILPPIPQQILDESGKKGIGRLDITVRVDGLDLSFDGAPACRDGHKRLVGRAPNGPPGSFDETALDACMKVIQHKARERRIVALVARAGPAVPSTFVDALAAAIKRTGVKDVVVTP